MQEFCLRKDPIEDCKFPIQNCNQVIECDL